MNLAIEYLIRTGAIRNFFTAPCTLCVEHWIGAKMVVGIENAGRSEYLVTHWHLEELDEDQRFPKSCQFKILKEELFVSDKIIPSEYHLLPYQELSVGSGHNQYNRPMYEDIYDSYLDQLLYSQKHQEIRSHWMWKAFLKIHISRPLLPLIYYEYETGKSIMNLEKSIVAEDSTKWMIWCAWKRRLLRGGRIAPELVFQQFCN